MKEYRGAFKTTLLIIVIAVLFVCASISVFQGCKNALFLEPDGSKNFRERWLISRLILDGENPYTATIGESLEKNIIKEHKAHGFIPVMPLYVPSAQFFMIPYALLGLKTAKAFFLATNLVMTLALFYALFRFVLPELSAAYRMLIALLFLAGTPYRMVLGSGESSVIVLACFLLGYHADKKGRWALSGCLLAASMFKYHLILPFLLAFFVLQKRWRPLVLCGAIHTAAHIAVCRYMHAPPLGVFSHPLMLIYRKVLRSGSFDIFSIFWHSWLNNAASRSGALSLMVPGLAIAIALAFFTVLFLRDERRMSFVGKLSLVGIFSLFYCYHRSYDFVALIFPLTWILMLKGRIVLRAVIGLALSYLFFGDRLLLFIMRSTPHIADISSSLTAAAFFAVFFSVSGLAYAVSSGGRGGGNDGILSHKYNNRP